MSADSIAPDNWCVVTHLPFSGVNEIGLPTLRFFHNIRTYPLQRIPRERESSRPYRHDTDGGHNRPNSIAFLIAATGEEMPETLRCTSCARGRRGHWEGCFVSAAEDPPQERFGYGCSNCVYHGGKAKCSHYGDRRPGEFLGRPPNAEIC